MKRHESEQSDHDQERDICKMIISDADTTWNPGDFLFAGMKTPDIANICGGKLERDTGIEPATSSLGSWHSTN